jgi:hypothetical protein
LSITRTDASVTGSPDSGVQRTGGVFKATARGVDVPINADFAARFQPEWAIRAQVSAAPGLRRGQSAVRPDAATHSS